MINSPEERQPEQDSFVIVEFRQFGEKNGHLIGITRSFSPEGISFDSQNYALPQGEKLECTLKHPGNNLSVPATGMISEKKELWYKCVTELKFIDMNEEDKGRIMELLSSIPPRCESSDGCRYPGPPGVPDETDVPVATAAPVFHGNAIEKETPPRKKKNRYVIPAVAVCALIVLAGIYFSVPVNEGKDRDSGTGPLVTDAVNSQTDNLSDETRAAGEQDASPENKQMDMEQPAAMPNEPIIDAGRPGPDIGVQPPDPGTIQKTDEAVHISTTVYGDQPVEVPAGINTDSTSSGGNDTEKTKGLQATTAIKNESVPDVKNQTVSADAPLPQNNMANHPSENKTAASPAEQTVVYNESFDNNADKWDIFNTGMASALIKNGAYHLQNKRKEGAHIILQHSDFPFGLNFSIEVLVRLVKSSGRHSYGLVFGAKDARDYYTFQVNASDSYSVRQYREGSVRELAGGKMKNPVNSLKIVRHGGEVSFYINDVYANKVADISLPGNKMGFIVDGEAEIAIDRTRSQIFGFSSKL